MQQRPVDVCLELLQQLVNLIVQVLCRRQRGGHLHDEERPQRRLLGVVLHVDVDDVHGAVVQRRPSAEVLHHLVVHPLLAGEDHIELLRAVLEALRTGLDAPVAVQHVQDAVLGVPV